MTPLDLARWRALCEEAVHDALGHGVVTDERAANVVRMVLAAFVAGEVEGPYDVVAPFEDGPLTRVRHKTLFGHEWSFAYQHMARAVANVLNYLEAQRA